MQMINGAPLAANGKISVTLADTPPATYNAAFGYEADGSLAANSLSLAITSWNSGLAFDNGRLRVVDILSNAIPPGTSWSFQLPVSLPVSDQNMLVCTTSEPVARYVHGWPVAANGAVCIVSGVPVVNAFTNGFDTGFD